jgi:energy-coupling factor transporter ATP-binding protein EcfA2
MLVWQRPNLLLLDEPTNHLDLDTREALSMALNEFEGTVMLVSHDRALLREVCDEFWLVAAGGVRPFDGDLDDYQRWSARRVGAHGQRGRKPPSRPGTGPDPHREPTRARARQPAAPSDLPAAHARPRPRAPAAQALGGNRRDERTASRRRSRLRAAGPTARDRWPAWRSSRSTAASRKLGQGEDRARGRAGRRHRWSAEGMARNRRAAAESQSAGRDGGCSKSAGSSCNG